MEPVTIIGKVDWRNLNIPFGIKQQDRFAHIYAIGKTGVGKSTLLLNMAIQDIHNGNGLCVIDPHGDLAETLLDYVPKERIEDVIYFNPQDAEYPIAFNPLYGVSKQDYHRVASGLISTFKKIWLDSWGPRLEYILRYCLLTLLEYPEGTLLDIQPLLTDIVFRNIVLDHVTNPHIIDFWKLEYEKYPPALKAEAISPILNKTGVFISNVPLRNIVGQKRAGLSIPEIMDSKKILIVNLAKGQIGEDACSILGSMLITSIQLAATAKSTQPEQSRIPFFLYIDEVHSFATSSFIDLLSEVRKYKLGLFLTHQYIDQLPESIRKAILGNVGTIISFRISATDSKYLATEFSPVFSDSDFVQLRKYAVYIKLMIDGIISKGFSAVTDSLPHSRTAQKKEIIAHSRMENWISLGKVGDRIFNHSQLKQNDLTTLPKTLF